MNLRDSLAAAFFFVVLIWAVWIVDLLLIGIDFANYGIYPREESGLIGVAFAPLIHGGRLHLLSNSAPLFILTALCLYFYRGVIWIAGPFIYIVSGLLVWGLARTAFHIGASGVIYGMAAFLVFSGIFRGRVLPLLLALIVAGLYGGLVWGVLPTNPGVSWEAHLFGAISGGTGAYLFRRVARE